jgi:hypothetical protein
MFARIPRLLCLEIRPELTVEARMISRRYEPYGSYRS